MVAFSSFCEVAPPPSKAVVAQTGLLPSPSCSSLVFTPLRYT